MKIASEQNMTHAVIQAAIETIKTAIIAVTTQKATLKMQEDPSEH